MHLGVIQWCGPISYVWVAFEILALKRFLRVVGTGRGCLDFQVDVIFQFSASVFCSIDCHDPAPIFHFPPPPQVIPTTPSPPATQPARAQQAPVRHQSPASIPLPPSPPPMDICPPSPPHPTLTHLMPQLDVSSLADAYMQTSPSSPKAKYLWEAFNCAKGYASEARDRTPPPLPMEAESTSKSHRREACDSPATPITPAMRRHSPSPEAPRTRRNSEDSYDDCKDPSHLLY